MQPGRGKPKKTAKKGPKKTAKKRPRRKVKTSEVLARKILEGEITLRPPARKKLESSLSLYGEKRISKPEAIHDIALVLERDRKLCLSLWWLYTRQPPRKESLKRKKRAVKKK